MKKFDESNFETRRLRYIYDGLEKTISIPVYRDVKNHFSLQNPTACSSLSEFYFEYLSNSIQRHYLNPLIEAIWEHSKKVDEQARIAINLVQRIPYDVEKWRFEIKNNPYTRIRYPYEVIVDNKGICCEKSLLLALLLREFGFGLALFIFENENHMAIGIKCHEKFSFCGTGYGFVETAAPSIITDDELHYVEINKLGVFRHQLKSKPIIVPLCDGSSFTSIFQEFIDAKEWNQLIGEYRNEEGYYDERRYHLIQKYGL
jgi:hypothetical protein